MCWAFWNLKDANANGMGDKKKKAQMFIRLVSAAGTGFFYVKRKPRQLTEKLEFRKYDPRVNRHVLFTEAKMK
ncbi:50S ribosomal protein L33 [Quillaja saponaria]|uniref:50S ribosomal protein L33, chloroplastic n=1 Tax=Quillaja saponaria TaxID=32244 RepID=A0AAD7LQA7_QUISA|nr:50S ribosomal protein L33 [Quillaja saponaria]